MDSTHLNPMLESLGENVDDLEEALGPLLKMSLAEITAKLPLLEKAKLQVLVTYAIESIIFSALKLNGVDARQHAVFRELTRVKQYFEKIKKAEEDGPKPRMHPGLDKAAAARFIRGALSGNEEYDRKRAEQRARERENAQRKFEETSQQVGSAGRFKQLSEMASAENTPKSAPATTVSSPQSLSSSNSDQAQPQSSSAKKRTREVADGNNEGDNSTHKKRKKNKKHPKPDEGVSDIVSPPQQNDGAASPPQPEKRKKSKKHPKTEEGVSIVVSPLQQNDGASLPNPPEKLKKNKTDSRVAGVPSETMSLPLKEEEAVSKPPKEDIVLTPSSDSHKKRKSKKEHKKHKSSTTPKSGTSVFQELLNRPSKSKKHDEG